MSEYLIRFLSFYHGNLDATQNSCLSSSNDLIGLKRATTWAKSLELDSSYYNEATQLHALKCWHKLALVGIWATDT